MEFNLDIVLAGMVSLTMGLTQVYKNLLPASEPKNLLLKIFDKSAPLFALLVGVGLSLFYYQAFSYVALESGLIVGLVSAGVYSGGKTLLKKN